MPEGVDEFAESLLALSRLMLSEESLDATLNRVATIAGRTIGACEMAGVTLERDGSPATVAFTDAEAPEIDRAQYESDAGPCLEAYRTGITIRIQSMSEDARWPAFSQAALGHGIQSSLSLPLTVRDQTLGALNLYSKTVPDSTPPMRSWAPFSPLKPPSRWRTHSSTGAPTSSPSSSGPPY